MTEEHKITEKSEQEIKPLKENPELKSRFKPWMRIVAFIIVAVFLPEQVAQAIEYDGRVLWNRPAVYAPTYLQDIKNVDIPLAVKKILLDISGKPVNAIKISPTLTVELEKPLNLSKARVEEIYNWLEGRPCGSKALYEFLTYKGISVVDQDIAVLALTIDILNGVVKPEGDPEVIKNSLYALSQASDFFGLKLYPVKVDLTAISNQEISTPFIAHLKNDHYILITRITPDKVYFLQERKEEFWPKDKFLKEFSGYLLTPSEALRSQYAIADQEAKQVLGARSYAYDYADFSDLFEEPDTSDLLKAGAINLAFTIGTAYIGGMFSGFSQPVAGAIGGAIGGGFAGYVTGGSDAAFYGALGGAVGGYAGGSLGGGQWGSAFGAGIGSGAGNYFADNNWRNAALGAFGGGMGGYKGYAAGNSQLTGFDTSFNFSNLSSVNLNTYLTNFGTGMLQSQVVNAATSMAVYEFGASPEMAQMVGTTTGGAMTGALSSLAGSGQSLLSSIGSGAIKGAMQGGTNLLAYEALKDTSLYKNQPELANQIVSFAGNTVSNVAFDGAKGLINGQGLQGFGKLFFTKDQNGDKVLSGFTTNTINTLTSLGVQYAASEGLLGSFLKKKPQYNEILGSFSGDLASNAVSGQGQSGLTEAFGFFFHI